VPCHCRWELDNLFGISKESSKAFFGRDGDDGLDYDVDGNIKNFGLTVDWRCLFSELFREQNEQARIAFLSCADCVQEAPRFHSRFSKLSKGTYYVFNCAAVLLLSVCVVVFHYYFHQPSNKIYNCHMLRRGGRREGVESGPETAASGAAARGGGRRGRGSRGRGRGRRPSRVHPVRPLDGGGIWDRHVLCYR
jgi:hypothetical protein